MDAGVRAACAGTLYRVAHHRGQRILKSLLHGGSILLDLPAMVGCPYIHQF